MKTVPCGICGRPMNGLYVCDLSLDDPHRDPSALVQLGVCKSCAETVTGMIERMRYAA